MVLHDEVQRGIAALARLAMIATTGHHALDRQLVDLMARADAELVRFSYTYPRHP